MRVAMAVDITLLFRASVKTVKTRNKALGVAVGVGADGSRDELFRRSPRPKGDFSSRAREVVSWLLWERRAGDRGGSASRTLDPKLGPALLAVGEERESLARQRVCLTELTAGSGWRQVYSHEEGCLSGH